jgi:hypothetical protein
MSRHAPQPSVHFPTEYKQNPPLLTISPGSSLTRMAPSAFQRAVPICRAALQTKKSACWASGLVAVFSFIFPIPFARITFLSLSR